MAKKCLVRDLNTLVVHLHRQHELLGNWRKVANLPEYKQPDGTQIPARTLHAIAERGREPKGVVVRAVLGLPALLPAPACAKCGAVHVTRRCTAKRDNEYEMASDLWEIGIA